MDPVYSVVVPVYKSSESLPRLNREIIQAMESTGKSFEILYIDDESPDNTWQVLKELHQGGHGVRIIRLVKNVGMWRAMQCGVDRSRGQSIITIDDDLEFSPADILRLLDEFHSKDLAIVYGISDLKADHRRLFHTRTRLLDRFLGKARTESFRIFRRSIVKDEAGNRLSDLVFEAHAKHSISQRNVGYVMVDHFQRPHGISGHHVLKKLMLVNKYSPDYLRRPFQLFRLLGFASVGIALLFTFLGIIGVDTSALTSRVPDRKIVYLILGFMVLGIGYLGRYLVGIYYMLKGRPDYIIMDER